LSGADLIAVILWLGYVLAVDDDDEVLWMGRHFEK
jgi:hypothetical protein